MGIIQDTLRLKDEASPTLDKVSRKAGRLNVRLSKLKGGLGGSATKLDAMRKSGEALQGSLGGLLGRLASVTELLAGLGPVGAAAAVSLGGMAVSGGAVVALTAALVKLTVAAEDTIDSLREMGETVPISSEQEASIRRANDALERAGVALQRVHVLIAGSIAPTIELLTRDLLALSLRMEAAFTPPDVASKWDALWDSITLGSAQRALDVSRNFQAEADAEIKTAQEAEKAKADLANAHRVLAEVNAGFAKKTADLTIRQRTLDRSAARAANEAARARAKDAAELQRFLDTFEAKTGEGFFLGAAGQAAGGFGGLAGLGVDLARQVAVQTAFAQAQQVQQQQKMARFNRGATAGLGVATGGLMGQSVSGMVGQFGPIGAILGAVMGVVEKLGKEGADKMIRGIDETTENITRGIEQIPELIMGLPDHIARTMGPHLVALTELPFKLIAALPKLLVQLPGILAEGFIDAFATIWRDLKEAIEKLNPFRKREPGEKNRGRGARTAAGILTLGGSEIGISIGKGISRGVKKLRVGGPILEDSLAMLHRGEFVMPASRVPTSLQGMSGANVASSAGGDIHLHGTVMGHDTLDRFAEQLRRGVQGRGLAVT